MIFREHKAIFLHIPKCAGTSIKDSLAEYGENVGHKLMNTYTHSKWDDYYFFACVRNTYDRLFSFAIWKQRNKETNTQSDKNPVTYVQSMCNTANTNWIYYPHTKWLDVNRINRFIRYESLQEDFDLVCKDIGISQRDIPFLNKTKKNKPHYSLYYTDALITKVRGAYKGEIDYFGYEFDDQRP